MATRASLFALCASALVLCTEARHVLQQHKHEAVNVQRRQASPAAALAPMITPEPTTYTVITPSPGATPVPVTSESQIVTSYVPQFTLCELPPIQFFSISAAPLPSAKVSTAPYRNYSISIPPGNGTCTTIFSPTQTMVCATTLSDLATKYTVTNCYQDLTFSTEYGYVLVYPTSSANSSVSGMAAPSLIKRQATITAPTPPSNVSVLITPRPTIQTLTTYYLAPWQSLTAGTAPSNIILKVCTTFANGTYECIKQYQVWHTSLLTLTATSTISINISTTIHGLSQIIVETFVENITEYLTTFSMSTTLELEYETEIETTHTTEAPVSTGPTVTLTRTLEEAGTQSHTTRTSTIHRTSTRTVYVGTSTATVMPVPAGETALPEQTPDGTITASPDGALVLSGAPTPTTSIDFASLLGINEVQ